MKILYFTAPWCAACKNMKPVFEKVMTQTKDVEVETVDIDKEAEQAINMNVMSVPTLIFVKGDKIVDRLVGLCNQETLEELVSKWK